MHNIQSGQEVTERAYAADVSHEKDRAIMLYKKALEVMDEALRLDVPTSGLGPKVDTAAMWTSELLAWRENIHSR